MASQACKVVLLTGAGCSSLAGLRTLKGIVDSSQGIQVPFNAQDPAIEVAQETWKVVKGQKGDNATLEHLLARLKLYSETADLIRSDRVFSGGLGANLPHVISGQFKMTWENALGYCFRLMLDSYGPHKVQIDDPGYETIHKVFKLLAQFNGNCLNIFTTNYDCLLNVMAAKVRDITFYSHISNEDGAFTAKWYVVNKATFDEANPKLYVHRLHGCVAWFSDSCCPYGVREVYGSGDNLTINDQNKLNQMAIKLISSERIGSIPAFSLAFQELWEALEECEMLLVWGHSFRDLELLRCIINVSENRRNHPFNVYYIDPYLSEIEAIENIRTTVAGVPTVNAAVLKPQNLSWVTQDGLERLGMIIQRLLTSCSPTLKHGAPKRLSKSPRIRKSDHLGHN